MDIIIALVIFILLIISAFLIWILKFRSDLKTEISNAFDKAGVKILDDPHRKQRKL